MLALSTGSGLAGSGPLKAPVLLQVTFEGANPDSSLTVRNGETVQFVTRWIVPDSVSAADSLTVTAIFDSLEVPAADPPVVENLGGGLYRITHPISPTNLRRDRTKIPIPVRAAYHEAHTTTYFPNRTVCLSNHPPEHVATTILDPKQAPYTSLDSLRIKSTWVSPGGLALSVQTDESNVATDTSQVSRPKISKQVHSDTTTFIIRLRLPASANLQPDGPGKLIPIRARDSGCGSTYCSGCGQTIHEGLTIDLDATPPDTGLRVDPIPAVTTEGDLDVAGVAPAGADSVVILRNLFALPHPYSPVGADPSTRRFHSRIPLDAGRNQIQVRAEDAAGNSTALSAPQVVTRVSGAVLTVLTPYSRTGSENQQDIVLRDPEGITQATVRIFNLEGDCVWSATAGSGTQLEFGFHWGGVDGSRGQRAPQGYYLVHAEWKTSSGRARSLAHGLLMRD